MRQTAAHNRRQAGDTIVEVLLAIVVIATVLTGGFVLSRHSLNNVRDSQERTEALNLLQGQIESLRTAAAGVTGGSLSGYMNSGDPKFCMDNNGQPQDYSVDTCEGQGPGKLYKLSIIPEGKDSTTGTYLYLGEATWDSVNGGQDHIQLYYRLNVN